MTMGVREILVFACVGLSTSACGNDRDPERPDGGDPGTGGAGTGGSKEAGAEASGGRAAGGSPETRDGGRDAEPTDAGSLGLYFERIALGGGPVHPTELKFLPKEATEGSRLEFLLLEKEGTLSHYAISGGDTELLGSFTLPVYVPGDCGLISLAIDPDFVSNRHVFVGYSSDRKTNVVSRLTFDTSDYAAIPASKTDVIVVNEPAAVTGWHNVGAIGFEPNGVMWALFGDKEVDEDAQDPAKNLGKLLRIVPDPSGTGYVPAPDNPFIGKPGMSPDVYALGLRSPWRGAVDAAGRHWIADVGANDYEEIDIAHAPGMNFGWPDAEGACEESCSTFSDPTAGWGRSSDERYVREDPDVTASEHRTIWVAGPYGRAGIDRYRGRLEGAMLVGDFFGGWIRGMRLGEDRALELDVPLGHLPATVAWDEAPDGYFYAVTYGSYEGKEDVEDVARLYRALSDR
jgi:glucose/arabinose dehydrogenase